MSRQSRSSLIGTISQKKLKGYRQRIAENWRKATTSIVEVAKVCAEANNSLSPAEKKLLFEGLPFGQAVFSKLAAIGDDTRLHTPQMLKHLPPNYSIIYEVTHLEDKKLKAAVANKAITPSISRSEIVSLVKGAKDRQRKHILPDDKSDKFVFFAEIRVPVDLKKDEIAKINQFLAELEKSNRAKVTRPIDLPEYTRLVHRYELALSRYYDRILSIMRSLLRKEISKQKSSEKTKGRKWGLLVDETDLNVLPHELDDRIKQVLETLGRESDYDDLRKKAEQRTDTKLLNSIAQKLDVKFPFAQVSDEAAWSETKKSIGEITKREPRDFSSLKV
jgi:hypothetical protein